MRAIKLRLWHIKVMKELLSEKKNGYNCVGCQSLPPKAKFTIIQPKYDKNPLELRTEVLNFEILIFDCWLLTLVLLRNYGIESYRCHIEKNW